VHEEQKPNREATIRNTTLGEKDFKAMRGSNTTGVHENESFGDVR
jgi:hypothetical protein